MKNFKNKIAIVTGAASGIGKALALNLAQRGTDVVLADIQIEAAQAVAAEIQRAGGRASAQRLDVTDTAAVESLVNRVAADKGRLDYMFNNAGIAIIGEFQDLATADWKRILDINVGGVFAGTAAAYAVMIRQRSGHIVNTASVAGLIASPGLAAYCGSKHAVVGLSTSLRAEAAAYGVKVSAVCPGIINTPIVKSKSYGVPTDSKFHAQAVKISMTPEECAAVALKGVEKNLAIIPVTGYAKAAWALTRYAPALAQQFTRLAAGQFHRARNDSKGNS